MYRFAEWDQGCWSVFFVGTLEELKEEILQIRMRRGRRYKIWKVNDYGLGRSEA